MAHTRSEEPMHFLIDGLATYRLVKLIREDRISQPMRDAVESRWGPPEKSWASYLLDCPWCLSVYFGLGLTLLDRRWPRVTSMLARGLALSAVTGVATERVDQD